MFNICDRTEGETKEIFMWNVNAENTKESGVSFKWVFTEKPKMGKGNFFLF